VTDVGLRGPRPSEPSDFPLPRARRPERREVWVGLFVLVGMLSILTALFTFTEPSTFRGRYMLATVVENAGGVRRGDSVDLRGVSIGRIKGFDLVPQGVVLRLEIERRYKVPRDSRVQMAPGGLLGGMVAQIIPGEASEPAPSGAVLPGTKGETLTESVDKIATESEQTFGRVQQLLSDRTIHGIEESVGQLKTLLVELNAFVLSQRAEVDQLTKSLRRTAKNLERDTSGPELERAIRRLDPLTQKLEQAAASLDGASRSMELVFGRLERGEGTLGRLAKDETLYGNAAAALASLNQTSAEVRLLIKDVRENPKRYVHVSLF
jgi:phospholipid/cholesterol/gamma-HCH transport system substrate-binding protein